MPEHAAVLWPLMRVVREGIATETEIRQHWTISRLCDWYEVLLVERESSLEMHELGERMREEAARG